MNKNIATNVIALLICIAGIALKSNIVLTIGLFSLSGAITNWLAIHMLFEKVPGLYGSGVIPARFEDFKRGIRELMMTQFFTEENIDRLLSGDNGNMPDLHLAPVIEKVDLSPSFDGLIKVIMESSFGGMLGMFGGQDALIPLKEPFISSMKQSLIELTQQPTFMALLKDEIEQPDVLTELRDKVEHIVEQRLNELTPKLVKEIIQTMIKEHLGWLVVWGGVFGGLIGLVAAFLSTATF
ncbi:FIG00657639: hypothetical protein [hydrothermal vent metagenome]|uniref:DUF445 domain-containing protein n=1 Tax=hydrothermal vent metagenome TaxID=652676 RepID=A0A3B1B0U9_9ZZZZ